MTAGGRVTQFLAIVFMFPVSGLLYFLKFLSVDNSSLGVVFCFLSFGISRITHMAHSRVHGCEQRRWPMFRPWSPVFDKPNTPQWLCPLPK